ncbi:hypothetical protein [Kochikohdavirus PBEF19]|uniref:Uncharacterized protein n=1 Tax=Enterococcus phage PBEF129 TaxID=2696337 RepID=A0A7T3MK55_9CAUD|nr:hypothetical protein [Enterococcus phage PBEF129]
MLVKSKLYLAPISDSVSPDSTFQYVFPFSVTSSALASVPKPTTKPKLNKLKPKILVFFKIKFSSIFSLFVLLTRTNITCNCYSQKNKRLHSHYILLRILQRKKKDHHKMVLNLVLRFFSNTYYWTYCL